MVTYDELQELKSSAYNAEIASETLVNCVLKLSNDKEYEVAEELAYSILMMAQAVETMEPVIQRILGKVYDA